MAVFDAPSATNGYLPVATGQVISFILRPDEFETLNAIVQYTPSDLPTGVYAKLDRDTGVRISNEDQFLWADGTDLPSAAFFTSRFTTDNFTTVRRAYPWFVGGQAERNARLWKPKLTHMMEAISMCLTLRLKRMIRLLETAGSWAGNTQTATALGGGKWNAGTVANPYFSIGLLNAAAKINLATNGKIKINQLVCVLNVNDAILISRTAEILDFMKGSVHTQQMIKDPFGQVNAQWGLPDYYMGVKIHVSTEVNVTENMNQTGNEATTTRGRVKSSGSAIIVCRPGSMQNEMGEKSYSTVQVFHYPSVKAAAEGKDGGETKNGGAGLLEVKQKFDGWHEKHEGAVVEQTGEKVAAPLSGYLVTAII